MAEVSRLSVSQLTDDDLVRLFGQYYWYPGAPAMREQLAGVELYGYRSGRLEGVVGLDTQGDQTLLAPWTPAVADFGFRLGSRREVTIITLRRAR